MTFSEAIIRGAGNIVLKNAAGVIIARYDAASSANLSISGSVLTINPTSDLSNNTGYSVEFDAGSVKDIAGNAYVATNTYHFTTTAAATAVAGNDAITGSSGDDMLDGGTGANTLLGGAGNDTYIVNNASDKVFESTTQTSTTDAGGIDLVNSNVSFTLGNYIENLTLTGTADINGTGNTLANTLMGNAGANILDGAAGTDTVSYAYATAAITVSLSTTLAQETEGSGIDTLRNIENLTGSNYDDILTGNNAANTLNGGTGADMMVGRNGSDTYYVDNVDDLVIETNANLATGGTDTVLSYLSAYTLGANVENGRIMVTTAASLKGNSGANTLISGIGNDSLIGGAGADTLTGGAGNDTFYFNAIGDTGPTSTTCDVITDFAHGKDKIDLSAIDANATTTGSNDAFTFIGTVAFGSTNAAGQLRYVYDAGTTTGMLYGSTNADSSAEFVIKLTGMSSVALTASDFVL